MPISYTWSNFRQNQHINEHSPAKQSHKIWHTNFKGLLSYHILGVGSFYLATPCRHVLHELWSCVPGYTTILIFIIAGEPLTGAWPFPQAASIILYPGKVAMLSSVHGWAAEGLLPGSIARCDMHMLGGASSPLAARELLHWLYYWIWK